MTNLPRRAHRRAARRLTALVAATGLLLVACSSDGDSPPETAGTEAAEVETTVPEVDETLADDPVPTAAATQPAPAATPDDPPPQFRIATFNAGLAEGFVPLAAERLPLVAEAVADLDADLVFLQEVWTPEAVAELRNASSTTFTESVFPEPIPDSELGDPACTIDELADLEECIALNCADASPDDLVGCVLTNCASQYGGLCEECQTCIAANVGKTVDEAIANCTTSSSAYAYDGSVGIGLLSKSVILDSDVLVLESSLNRRAVLHALVDTEALGPVHVFGTHLSAVFSDIPYPGDGTWEEEQADQIGDLLAYIDSRADAGDPVVLLGDFNTGPGGSMYQAEVAANYELLTAAMFTNPYIESGARCTFCGDNPLQDGDTDVVIDHVLTRDLEARAVSQRILDESLMITLDGDDITTALSDHYGVLLALTCDPAE